MSRLKLISIIILILVFGSVFALWTPDTNYQQTREKYLDDDSRFITLPNNPRIHIRDTGEKGKPAILMIHGTSDSLLTWSQITKLLQPQFRLISLDLPGHGFSARGNTLSFTDFVSTVIHVLDNLEVRSVTLMGNSLGGGIAWRTALENHEWVNGLILLNPSGAPRLTAARSNLGFKILNHPAGRFIGRHITPRVLIKKSLLGSVDSPEIVDQKLIDRYWQLLRLPGNRQALSELATMPRDSDAWLRISEIETPTMIVWGATDAIIPPSNGEKFADKINNSELLMYQGVGHLPMIEAPRRLASDITRFMENRKPS